jgi:hypothetical protein
MVKRFFYLLALAILLQLSAGVASAYCMHETGAASEHFGHHQHEHQQADADADSSAPATKAGPDPDCASCSPGSLVIPSLSSDTAQRMPPSHQQLAQLPTQPTPYLGLPERPNWMRAA